PPPPPWNPPPPGAPNAGALEPATIEAPSTSTDDRRETSDHFLGLAPTATASSFRNEAWPSPRSLQADAERALPARARFRNRRRGHRLSRGCTRRCSRL